VVRHARIVNENTAFQVVLIDGEVLTRVADDGPVGLTAFLNEQAAVTMRHKEGQRLEIEEED
jgi:hypothetical protein